MYFLHYEQLVTITDSAILQKEIEIFVIDKNSAARNSVEIQIDIKAGAPPKSILMSNPEF